MMVDHQAKAQLMEEVHTLYKIVHAQDKYIAELQKGIDEHRGELVVGEEVDFIKTDCTSLCADKATRLKEDPTAEPLILQSIPNVVSVSSKRDKLVMVQEYYPSIEVGGVGRG
jgi:hypothetical protein